MHRIVHDQVGREVKLPFPPKRIISLCPSITETLFAIELEERIVGRTNFCIHPAGKVASIEKVGGTKKIFIKKIIELAPDLIIAEKEENTKEMVELLEQYYPVYVLDIETYEDGLKAIHVLGEITDRSIQAASLVKAIEEEFNGLQPIVNCRAAYLIWKDPYMAAGHHTYINAVLEKCGFVNVFAGLPGRYPTITLEEIEQAKPDVVFLSSEPYPFKETHLEELQQRWPNTIPLLVDGEPFCWHGARMLKAPKYLNEVIGSINMLI